jgi:glucose/arabinose dehydrogenase
MICHEEGRRVPRERVSLREKAAMPKVSFHALIPFSLALACASPLAAEDLAANGGAPPSVAQPQTKLNDAAGIAAKIKLPPGFKIALYALVPDARQIAISPNGKIIFVGTTGTKVYAILNDPAPGNTSTVKQFAPSISFTMPNGVCFASDGTLYVAEQNRILAFAHVETDALDPKLVATTIVKGGELIPRSEESRGHSARVCRIGPDNKLYVTLGQPYNVTPHDKVDLYRKLGIGGIIRMDRDGSHREVFASGIRNSVGLDFNPKDKTLWFTDNQVDGMGDDIPVEELNRAAQPGLNFGYPWYGGGHTRTNEYARETPPADAVFPAIETTPHAADLGMTFYSGTMFPEPYRGGIFNAQHGSWNRTVPTGARLMFSTLQPDGASGKTEPFAEGWLVPNGGYLGRPVDVAQMPDGSLLVSDDELGAIYRITYDAKQSADVSPAAKP